jgi:hypothetical protein
MILALVVCVASVGSQGDSVCPRDVFHDGR